MSVIQCISAPVNLKQKSVMLSSSNILSILQDKLHEYLGTMLAVNNAFSDRSSALLTVQTLSSELVSLKSRIEKLEVASSKIFGGDKSRMRKVEELKEAIRLTENAKLCAEREYERIKVAALFFFTLSLYICNSVVFLQP